MPTPSSLDMTTAHDRRLENAQRLGWDLNITSEPDVPFHPRVSKSTEHCYNDAVGLWWRFNKNHLGRMPTNTLPSAHEIKNWIRYISLGHGHLGNTPTQCTVQAYWRRLCCGLYRIMNEEFSEPVCREINDFIKGNIAPSGSPELYLTTVRRLKGNLPISDIKEMLWFLWGQDQKVFADERYRIQLAFCVLFTSYTADRIGAIVESRTRLGTNRSLLYKHCHVGLMAARKDSPAELFLTIQRFHTKGDEGRERTVTPAILHQTTFDFGHGLDPLILFLALAFADDAFDDGLTLEGLVEMQRSQVGLCRTFKWKESVAGIPVLRQCEGRGRVGYKRALTYSTVRRDFDDLTRRSGFLGSLTFGSIRRAAGGAVNGKVSQSDHLRVMGHRKTGTFEMFYALNPVDTQSIVLGREPRDEMTSQLLRAGCRHDTTAPQTLPDNILMQLEGDKTLRDYEKARADYLSTLQRRYGSLRKSPIVERRSYNSLYESVRGRRARLRNRALTKYQESWACEMDKTGEGLGTPSLPTNLTEYNNISIQEGDMHEGRRRIADGMFGFMEARDTLDVSLVSALIDLCSGGHRRRKADIPD
ncbi:hypothetical protein HOY80DRAFT_940028 [Tuber brumale]|nr:hypothetical protein HOY80DRAFT_940028 [Tuber brumale]